LSCNAHHVFGFYGGGPQTAGGGNPSDCNCGNAAEAGDSNDFMDKSVCGHENAGDPVMLKAPLVA
jgi:hypothetical protein